MATYSCYKGLFVESLEWGADGLEFFHKYHLLFWLTCKLHVLTEIRHFHFALPNSHERFG